MEWSCLTFEKQKEIFVKCLLDKNTYALRHILRQEL